MKRALFASIGAGLLMVATSARAHHSFGTFLMNENIELKGAVTKFDYVNPHSWLHLAVTGADGQTAEYKCEMRSATTLRRSGWTPEMFAAGTRVTVQGSPDGVDPHSCYVSTLIFADGTQLDRYGQRIEAKPTTERSPPFRHRKALVVRSKTGEVNRSRRRLAARGLFQQSVCVLRQANACLGHRPRQAGMARLAEGVGNL